MPTTDTPDILELAERTVRNTFGRFDQPDDDWAATLMFPNRRGRPVMVMVGGPDSDTTAANIEHTLAAAHVSEAVFIASCWVTRQGRPIPGTPYVDGPRPSQASDRRELIAMYLITRGGCEMHGAYIERFDDRPPRLGPFMLDASGIDVSGRFPDAMRRGIGYGTA